MTTWRSHPHERSDPLPLGEVIDRVAGRLGMGRSQAVGTIFSRWEELVGPDIAAHATPTSLRNGELVLEVDEPAWAVQLRYMSAELVERLASSCGPAAVRQLRVRVSRARP